MCSILLGAYAPVDTSDGSGTNLNQLQEQKTRSGQHMSRGDQSYVYIIIHLYITYNQQNDPKAIRRKSGMYIHMFSH